MKARSAIHAVLVSLACLGGAACGAGAESEAAEIAPTGAFPVAIPTVKTVTISREYVAQIRAGRYAELRSRYRGVLESVAADDGQVVRSGQTLFTINARAREQDLAVARAATTGARAELQAAQLDVDSTQQLADKNIVAPAELARAKAKVSLMQARLDQARAAESRAKIDVGRAAVRAPFDGRLDRIPHRTGSAVSEDELLTTITDTHEMLAYFAVSEREYLAMSRPGGAAPHDVSLRLADGTLFDQRGEIDAVAGALDPETGTITYRARFPNPDGRLRHGSSGKIVIASELRDALLVPQRATFEVQGDVYVYVVGPEGVVRARKIAVKARLEEAFVVGDGLGPGDRFVVEGIQRLHDGMLIDPRGERS